MTADEFVNSLRESVERSADALADKLAKLPRTGPAPHLAKFAGWYQALPAADRETAREVIRYAAAGGLFVTLSHLGGTPRLSDAPGDLEVWSVVDRDGNGTWLNPPHGPTLAERFNAPPAAT